jgi:hypothetical protein
MARISIQNPSQRITPLWIVAAFLSLTEVTLGYALTRVEGGIQLALTVFVISFALLVAGAFFLILWNRPYVFYAPSEYGDVDPKHFMSAIRDAPLVLDQLQLAKSVEENPSDIDARFSLIDAMADDVQCQLIIFMHETGKEVPRWIQYVYEYAEGGAGSGTLDSSGRSKLEGTGLVKALGGGRYLGLTPEGHQFAEWLLRKGRKCHFFWSPLGGWGTPKPGGSAEKWLYDATKKAETTPNSLST